MTRLCFGSFGTIIKLHSRNKSNAKIVSALVGTIDPTNRYAEDNGASLRVLNCERDFSIGIDEKLSKEPMSRILELVNDVDEKSVIENFKSDVIPLLKKEKMESLILSLLFIIEYDATIDVDSNPVVLQKHFGIKVNPLDLENRVFSKVITLSDFLAHTLRYIIKETKNNTADNQKFVKLIREGDYIKTISGKHHVLKLSCTQDSSPEYHVMKINWDEDTQTLTLVSSKTESVVMNGAIIEQGASNGMLTETRLLTASEEVEMPGSTFVSVHQYSASNNTEALEKEKVEEKKSPLEEFNLAISEYKFEEFIESEPLKMFTTNPEISAEELESQYAEYTNVLKKSRRELNKSLYDDPCDNSKFLFNDYPGYDVDDEPDDNFSYTDKFLTPTLLEMSQGLANAIARLLPDIKDSGHPVYDTVKDFKDKLEAYNDFLKKHLKEEDDHFIYDIESVVSEEEALEMQGAKKIMAICVDIIDKHKNIDGKRISLEYIKNTNLDEENRIAGFHRKTRQDRGAICSLYEKTLKQLFRSGI